MQHSRPAICSTAEQHGQYAYLGSQNIHSILPKERIGQQSNKGSVVYSEKSMEEVLSQVLSDVWNGVGKVESDNQGTGHLFYDPNSHTGG